MPWGSVQWLVLGYVKMGIKLVVLSIRIIQYFYLRQHLAVI
jgi:hypothetical protein